MLPRACLAQMQHALMQKHHLAPVLNAVVRNKRQNYAVLCGTMQSEAEHTLQLPSLAAASAARSCLSAVLTDICGLALRNYGVLFTLTACVPRLCAVCACCCASALQHVVSKMQLTKQQAGYFQACLAEVSSSSRRGLLPSQRY